MSNHNVNESVKRLLRRMSYQLVALVLAGSLAGCSTTPWGRCEPCVTPCNDAPACWGYFPTCWRPWPCPDPCPVVDWDPAYESIEAHHGAFEAVPFEQVVPDPPVPSAEISPDTSYYYEETTPPADESDSLAPLIPTIDPNLTDTAKLIEKPIQLLFRPLPKVDGEFGSVEAVSLADPEGRKSDVVLTGAQTPFPPRAHRTVQFLEP